MLRINCVRKTLFFPTYRTQTNINLFEFTKFRTCNVHNWGLVKNKFVFQIALCSSPGGSKRSQLSCKLVCLWFRQTKGTKIANLETYKTIRKAQCGVPENRLGHSWNVYLSLVVCNSAINNHGSLTRVLLVNSRDIYWMLSMCKALELVQTWILIPGSLQSRRHDKMYVNHPEVER